MAVDRAPHCDASVLHAPSECWACDLYPEWQKQRDIAGINFTGHYDEDKTLCPSEHKRPIEKINLWQNNRPNGE